MMSPIHSHSNIVKKIMRGFTRIPFIVLSNKTDLPEQQQTISPADVCKELGVPLPLKAALKTQEGNTDIFNKIARAAIKPHEAVPIKSSLRKHKNYTWLSILSSAAVAGIIIYGYTYFKREKQQK